MRKGYMVHAHFLSAWSARSRQSYWKTAFSAKYQHVDE